MNQDRLRELLSYDPDTGVFTWLVPKGRSRRGQVAGCVSVNGYVEIRIDRHHHLGHRLAWLYVFGEFPKEQIDHINNDRSDNRLSNLRAATNSQNHCNKKRPVNNTSGVKGVTWDTDRQRWAAQLVVNGNRKFLGRFAEIADATAAVEQARAAMHKEFANNG